MSFERIKVGFTAFSGQKCTKSLKILCDEEYLNVIFKLLTHCRKCDGFHHICLRQEKFLLLNQLSFLDLRITSLKIYFQIYFMIHDGNKITKRYGL